MTDCGGVCRGLLRLQEWGNSRLRMVRRLSRCSRNEKLFPSGEECGCPRLMGHPSPGRHGRRWLSAIFFWIIMRLFFVWVINSISSIQAVCERVAVHAPYEAVDDTKGDEAAVIELLEYIFPGYMMIVLLPPMIGDGFGLAAIAAVLLPPLRIGTGWDRRRFS